MHLRKWQTRLSGRSALCARPNLVTTTQATPVDVEETDEMREAVERLAFSWISSLFRLRTRSHAHGRRSPPARHPNLRARRAAQCKKCGEGGQAGAGVASAGVAGGPPGRQICENCEGVRRRLETLRIRAAQGEREVRREEGRSAEEGRGNVHGVWNETNAQLWVRRRRRFFGADRRERGRKTAEEGKGEVQLRKKR